MDTKIYIIFRNGIPFELVRGEFDYRMARLVSWRELSPEALFSISNVGIELLDQYEY